MLLRSNGGGNCSGDGGAHEGGPDLHPTDLFTGIIPFSDCGDFVASLVSGVVSFMAEGRVGSVKG